MTRLAIDTRYLASTLKDLLAIPSPTGYTDTIVRHVSRELKTLGLEVELTRRKVAEPVAELRRGGAAEGGRRGGANVPRKQPFRRNANVLGAMEPPADKILLPLWLQRDLGREAGRELRWAPSRAPYFRTTPAGGVAWVVGGTLGEGLGVRCGRAGSPASSAGARLRHAQPARLLQHESVQRCPQRVLHRHLGRFRVPSLERARLEGARRRRQPHLVRQRVPRQRLHRGRRHLPVRRGCRRGRGARRAVLLGVARRSLALRLGGGRERGVPVHLSAKDGVDAGEFKRSRRRAELERRASLETLLVVQRAGGREEFVIVPSAGVVHHLGVELGRVEAEAVGDNEGVAHVQGAVREMQAKQQDQIRQAQAALQHQTQTQAALEGLGGGQVAMANSLTTLTESFMQMQKETELRKMQNEVLSAQVNELKSMLSDVKDCMLKFPMPAREPERMHVVHTGGLLGLQSGVGPQPLMQEACRELSNKFPGVMTMMNIIGEGKQRLAKLKEDFASDRGRILRFLQQLPILAEASMSEAHGIASAQ